MTTDGRGIRVQIQGIKSARFGACAEFDPERDPEAQYVASIRVKDEDSCLVAGQLTMALFLPRLPVALSIEFRTGAIAARNHHHSIVQQCRRVLLPGGIHAAGESECPGRGIVQLRAR